VDCEGHEEAARQEDEGVVRAHPIIEMSAAFDKSGMIGDPINRVTENQSTEEENLRGKKCPDAERIRFLLLGLAIELLVNESGGFVRHLL
jgi:hypothetical protein